jgi:hypothetical protein
VIKLYAPILLAVLILTACHPEVPIAARPSATMLITSQNPQCKIFKSMLKSGAVPVYQAMITVKDDTLLSFIYADYTPDIRKEADLVGVDSIEVSCTSDTNQVIKAAKPFTGVNRTYPFSFSDLMP